MGHFDNNTFLRLWLEAERARHKADPNASSHLDHARRYANVYHQSEHALLCEVTAELNKGQLHVCRELLSYPHDNSGLFSYLLAKISFAECQSEPSKKELFDISVQRYKEAIDALVGDEPSTMCLRSWAQNNLGNIYLWYAKRHLEYPKFMYEQPKGNVALIASMCSSSRSYLLASIDTARSLTSTTSVNYTDIGCIYYQMYNLGSLEYTLARNCIRKQRARKEKPNVDQIAVVHFVDQNAVDHLKKAYGYLSEACTTLDAMSPNLDPSARAVLERERGTIKLWLLCDESGYESLEEVRNHWKLAKQKFHESERQNVSDRFKRAIVEEKLRLLDKFGKTEKNPQEAFKEMLVGFTENSGNATLLWAADSEAALSGYSTNEEEVYARIVAVTHDAYT